MKHISFFHFQSVQQILRSWEAQRDRERQRERDRDRDTERDRQTDREVRQRWGEKRERVNTGKHRETTNYKAPTLAASTKFSCFSLKICSS